MLTPQTLAYGRVGWARSKFTVTQQQNGDMPRTDEWIDGIVVGFGLEQDIAQSIGLRLDYRHTFYADEPTNANNAGTRTDSYEIESDVVTVGVLYKF
jgi:opacity protein-like surface antigen